MIRAYPVLGTMLVLAACGADAKPVAEVDASDAPIKVTNDAGITLPDASPWTPPTTFAVSVDSNDVDLCAGECADLRATTRNASGAVSYAWSDGLPAGESQHVCPTSTHSYQVEATASATSGEFVTNQKASDGLTVSVRDCTVPKDDGVLCELRHRYDYPANGDVFSATKSWLSLGTYVGSSSIEMTPDGGAWMVGSFGGELDLGAGRVKATSAMSGFLHKLDKDCKSVKTIVLHATSPTDTVMPGALAVDAQGNAYVASIAGPLVSFNLLSPQPIRWTNELLIEKFSATGESLYRYRIATSIGGMLSDLEVNAAGEAFVAGSVPATTDLGGGPIGFSFLSFHTVVFKLSADGKFAKQLIGSGAYQLAIGGDRVFSVVNTGKSYDILASLLGTAPEVPVYGIAGRQQSDLAERWRTPWSPDEYPSLGKGISAGGLAVIYSSETAVSEGVNRRVETVRRYDGDGALSRETNFIDRTIDLTAPDAGIEIPDLGLFSQDYFWFSHMSEGEPGTLALAGSFGGNFMLAGVQLTSKSNLVDLGDGTSYAWVDPSALVLKLNADDSIRWVRQQDWGYNTWLAGVSSAATGDVFVVGQASLSNVPPTGQGDLENDMVVRKLRAN